ncbi:MAG: hypothetical protein AAGJ10_04140 [Bacteroidota bacterium]
MPDRVYSEQEIAQILQRALERQDAATEKRRSRAQGLNLDELERLAAESGIDPEHLRAAALEVHRPGVQSTAKTTSTHIIVERFIPGHLTDEAWGQIVSALRDEIGVAGQDQISVIGTMHDWSGSTAMGYATKATFTQQGDRVAMRLTQRTGNMQLQGIFLGLSLALLPAIIIGETQGFAMWQGLSLFTALSVLLCALLVPLLTAWQKKKHQQLEAAATRIETLISSQPTAAEQTGTAQPRLDLPSEEPPTTTSTSAANRTRA